MCSYEKMISGKYLGEIVRQVCLTLIEKRLLFGGKSSDLFKTREKFLSDYVSTIEQGYVYMYIGECVYAE